MLTRTINLYTRSFSGLSWPVWRLAMVTLINRSGTMVIPFLTVYLTTIRQFTLTDAGWVMSCFGAGSVLGTLLGGRLTDRLGYYYVQFWSLLLGGIMFFVLQRMESFVSICITIFLLSTIADAFRPANMAAIAVYSKPQNRTRSVSLIRLAINLGFTIGPATGGLIAASIGYDWLFWLDGMTCIGAAFFFLFFLENKAEPVSREDEEAAAMNPASSAYKDPTFLIFIFLMFLSALAFLQFFSTVPVYFRQELLFNEAQIGALFAVNGLLIFFLEMPFVFILETRFNLMILVAFGALLIGCSFLMFNVFSGWVFAAWLAIVVITFGEMLNLPFANAFALGRSKPTNRGQYMALYGNAYSVGHVFSPIIGMQVAANFGFATLWYLLGALCLVSFTGLWFLNKRS